MSLVLTGVNALTRYSEYQYMVLQYYICTVSTCYSTVHSIQYAYSTRIQDTGGRDETRDA